MGGKGTAKCQKSTNGQRRSVARRGPRDDGQGDRHVRAIGAALKQARKQTSERATEQASITAEPRRSRDGGEGKIQLVSSCKGSHKIAKPHEESKTAVVRQLWSGWLRRTQTTELQMERTCSRDQRTGMEMVAAGRPSRCMLGQVPDGLDRDTCSAISSAGQSLRQAADIMRNESRFRVW